MTHLSILAEVMDKEPSGLWLVSCGAAIALVAAGATRYTRWALLVFGPLAVLGLCGLTSEIRDPFVGPAILREAGFSYIFIAWVSGLLPTIGCVVGWLWRSKVRPKVHFRVSSSVS